MYDIPTQNGNFVIRCLSLKNLIQHFAAEEILNIYGVTPESEHLYMVYASVFIIMSLTVIEVFIYNYIII